MDFNDEIPLMNNNLKGALRNALRSTKDIHVEFQELIPLYDFVNPCLTTDVVSKAGRQAYSPLWFNHCFNKSQV